MEKRRFTRDAYTGVAEGVARAGGDTSHAGRQHIKKTGKINPLVDPAGYDLIRKSHPRYTQQPDSRFVLPNGIPMLIEGRFDTTGSMGSNVRMAFESLPKQYDLLANGKLPVLGRYDPQILNGIFGDVVDGFVLYRSQAEMDAAIATQLTLMVPEGQGGDGPEDPEYGLFGGAYLTDAFINRYGLKYYDFTVTDATSHGRIDRTNLERVFGPTVFQRVRDNKLDLNEGDLPGTEEIVHELKKRAHAFALIVGYEAARYWQKFYGKEHVVVIDSTRHLAYVQATVIGLTEGVIDLQSASDYLKSVGCTTEAAKEIQRQVAGIPIGAQTTFENFEKIPLKGAVFANKHDLWPVADQAAEEAAGESSTWL